MIDDPPLLTIRRPSGGARSGAAAAFRDAPTGWLTDAMQGARRDGLRG